MADQLRAGLEGRVVDEAALAHEAREGAARATRSEIARDGRLEFAASRRRTPEAERLRLAPEARSGEGAGLGAFEGARLAGQ